MKHVKSDGNGNIEREDKPAKAVPFSLPVPAEIELLMDRPGLPRSAQLQHAWNPNDRSLNIFVKEDDEFTFHRHPVAQSTDSIRGRQGYTSGVHVWEVSWALRQRGTHAVIGVATKEAPLHSPAGYQSLVGSNKHSWGWDLGRNKAYHDSDHTTYPAPSASLHAPSSTEKPFTVPDNFLMILDMEAGTLSFMVDGRYLGPAHSQLKGKTLYPIVSAVWGHCEVSLKYRIAGESGPSPLSHWCRLAVRRQVGVHKLENGGANKLGLPTPIRDFVLHR